MHDKKLVLVSMAMIAMFIAAAQKGITVSFPRISNPVQITESNKEHLFASYYGINSFSNNERYVTVLETEVKFKIPDENDAATLGLVDLKTNKFFPLKKCKI